MAANRILIVEDEPLIAMMLEDFVEMVGKSVAGVADSVATALTTIEAGGVEAAILDLNLRGGEKSTPGRRGAARPRHSLHLRDRRW